MSSKEQIDLAFETLVKCFVQGGKLLLCGNGGSAADCDHIAAELVNGMTKRTAGLPAFSLCSQSAVITAIANDIGYEDIFAQQVRAYGREGDVLMALSTSGKSPNILKALNMATEKHMSILFLIGASDLSIQENQEMHQHFYHELCRRLEEEFFP
jgi:D-sedoheptulose 7-phosphate isomerase